jgi:hypothetical protein
LKAGRRVGIAGPRDPDGEYQQGDREGEYTVTESLNARDVTVSLLDPVKVSRFTLHVRPQIDC